jgi:hypothetical protein
VQASSLFGAKAWRFGPGAFAGEVDFVVGLLEAFRSNAYPVSATVRRAYSVRFADTRRYFTVTLAALLLLGECRPPVINRHKRRPVVV